METCEDAPPALPQASLRVPCLSLFWEVVPKHEYELNHLQIEPTPTSWHRGPNALLRHARC